MESLSVSAVSGSSIRRTQVLSRYIEGPLQVQSSTAYLPYVSSLIKRAQRWSSVIDMG